MAKSSGGPSAASACGKLQLNRCDAALLCIVATHCANGPCTCDRRIERDRTRGELGSRVPALQNLLGGKPVIFDKSAVDWMIPRRSSNRAAMDTGAPTGGTRRFAQKGPRGLPDLWSPGYIELANKNRNLGPCPWHGPFEQDFPRLAIDCLSSKFAVWANCSWVRREVALHLCGETHWAG
jgi:hypothetical protein